PSRARRRLRRRRLAGSARSVKSRNSAAENSTFAPHSRTTPGAGLEPARPDGHPISSPPRGLGLSEVLGLVARVWSRPEPSHLGWSRPILLPQKLAPVIS